MTIRSPWACKPSTTGMATWRSRWSSTASPVRVVSDSRVTVMAITSGAADKLGVLLRRQAVGPARGGDRITEVAGHGQAVPAAVPVALGGPVDREEHPGVPAHVVQPKLGSGIAGIGRGGDQPQSGPVDVLGPADTLDRAPPDLDVLLPRDPLHARIVDHPGGHRRAVPGVYVPPVGVPYGRPVPAVQPHLALVAPHLGVHGDGPLGDHARVHARP